MVVHTNSRKCHYSGYTLSRRGVSPFESCTVKFYSEILTSCHCVIKNIVETEYKMFTFVFHICASNAIVQMGTALKNTSAYHGYRVDSMGPMYENHSCKVCKYIEHCGVFSIDRVTHQIYMVLRVRLFD